MSIIVASRPLDLEKTVYESHEVECEIYSPLLLVVRI